MKEMRNKKKEETDLKELADLCMEIQKYKLESKNDTNEGKYKQRIREKDKKIGNTLTALRRTIQERDALSKICKELDKRFKAAELERANTVKQNEGNEVVLKVWKGLINEKERTILIQREKIKGMSKELSKLRLEVHRLITLSKTK